MPTNRYPVPPSSEITPESLWVNRRKFIATAGALSVGLLGADRAGAVEALAQGAPQSPQPIGTPMGLQPDDKATPWEDVTGYNNFYEFGTGKEDPAENAHTLRTRPWTVKV